MVENMTIEEKMAYRRRIAEWVREDESKKDADIQKLIAEQ
jgi:hypothetical protein